MKNDAIGENERNKTQTVV